MWIKSVLTEELTIAHVESASKKRVIDTLAQLFADHFEEIDADLLFKHLIGREKLGSTGIGDGIAIPHCRFPTQGRTLCACLTLAEAIDFDAIDHNPVDVVFAMIVPEGEDKQHLENLASLASALQNKSFVQGLREARDSHELYLAATKE